MRAMESLEVYSTLAHWETVLRGGLFRPQQGDEQDSEAEHLQELCLRSGERVSIVIYRAWPVAIVVKLLNGPPP